MDIKKGLYSAFILFSSILILTSIVSAIQNNIVQDWKQILIFPIILTFFLVVLIFEHFFKYESASPGLSFPSDWIYLILIVFITLSTRALALYLLDTKPTSDFLFIHQLAVLLSQGKFSPINDITFPIYHNNTALVYSLLYTIFGASPTVIKLFNSVIAAMTGITLYFSGKMLTGKYSTGFLTAVFYLFWPSMVIYVQVLSAEHIFIFLQSILLLLYIYIHKNRKDLLERLRPIHVGFYIFLGLLIALSEAFRPFGPIYLVAFLITDLLFVEKTRTWKLTLVPVSLLAAAVLSFVLFRQIPILAYERMNKVQYMDTKAVNILIGLNFDTKGTYSADDWDTAKTIYSQTGRNQNEFNRMVVGQAVNRLKPHIHQLLPFLRTKYEILWSGEGGLFWAVRESLRLNAGIIYSLSVQANRFYLLVVAILMVGSVFRHYQSLQLRVIFFCALVLFGFNLLEAFSEVQARYTSVMIPLLSFITAWTVSGSPDSKE